MTADAGAPPGVFTVRGIRNGSRVHVTWSNGVLTGDPPTVDLLEVEAVLAKERSFDPLVRELHAGAPEGFAADPLATATSAFYLIERVLDIVRDVEGDVPPGAGATRRTR